MNELNNNSVIVKSNTIVHSHSKLDFAETRIFAIVISLIKKEDDDLKEYEINMNDIKKILGLNKQNVYDLVKKTLTKISKCQIEIKTNNEWVLFNLFTKVAYNKTKKIAVFKLNRELKKFFLRLKKNFTLIGLVEFLKLKTVYQMRTYEIVKSGEYKMFSIYSIEELRKILGVRENIYHSFGDFNIKVLSTARQGIKKHTSLYYEYTPIKTGKKVTAIKFHNIKSKEVSPKKLSILIKTSNLSVEPYEKTKHYKIINKHTYGNKRTKALKMFKKYPDYVIKTYNNIIAIKATNTTYNKIENFDNYFVGSLFNDFQSYKDNLNTTKHNKNIAIKRQNNIRESLKNENKINENVHTNRFLKMAKNIKSFQDK